MRVLRDAELMGVHEQKVRGTSRPHWIAVWKGDGGAAHVQLPLFPSDHSRADAVAYAEANPPADVIPVKPLDTASGT